MKKRIISMSLVLVMILNDDRIGHEGEIPANATTPKWKLFFFYSLNNSILKITKKIYTEWITHFLISLFLFTKILCYL